MNILYGKRLVTKQFLSPKETSVEPSVSFPADTNKLYILVMYDPDAVVGNYIHWLVTNIPGSNINGGKNIFEYNGPAPPKNSGTHHYIFKIYEQLTNNTINNNTINNNTINNNIINRTISLKKLLSYLGLGKKDVYPIYETYFISKNMEGGKKTRKRKRQYSRKKRQ